MKSHSSYFLLFFYFIFSYFLFPIATFAQNEAGITLIPAMVEEAANPGDVLNQTLKITNESDIERLFFVYKRNIKGVEAGGVPVFADQGEVTGYEVTEWLEFQTDPLLVPPHESVELPLIIRVPESATPGSHFGGIFVSIEPPKLREVGAGVGYEVASIVSIRISGDIVDTARIRSFASDRILYSTKDVHFTAKIENQGNILIRPRGPVSITSMFSSEAEVLTVNDTLAGVFPGAMRDLEFAWKKDGMGFGRYEAILALSYDGEDGQKTIDATLVFWIFPTKIILTIIGGFLSIFAIGYALTKYYVNRAILHAAGGRRISSQRYRKQVGISRLAFVFISFMTVLVIFLLVLLIFFA